MALKLTPTERRELRREIVEEIQTHGYSFEQAQKVNATTGWDLWLGEELFKGYTWSKGEGNIIQKMLDLGQY